MHQTPFVGRAPHRPAGGAHTALQTTKLDLGEVPQDREETRVKGEKGQDGRGRDGRGREGDGVKRTRFHAGTSFSHFQP